MGALKIDLASREVRRDGSVVKLTPREWKLLAELARAPGRGSGVQPRVLVRAAASYMKTPSVWPTASTS